MLEGGGEGKKGKGIVVILMGAPGSGKSTFCDTVIRSSTRPWSRICQVTLSLIHILTTSISCLMKCFTQFHIRHLGNFFIFLDVGNRESLLFSFWQGFEELRRC